MLRSKLFLLGILVGLSFSLCQAQDIRITEEPLIASMLGKYVESNKAKVSIEGWRVQLLATTDRRKLENARQQFQYRYPNISADWVHASPYYKLQAGAFRTKLEAIRLIHILKEDYPSAYPAKDNNIRPEELIGF